MQGLLLEKNTLRLNTAAAVSAGTAVTGATIDTAGHDSVLVFASIATFNAGNFLKLQGGALANGSDAADIAGSKCVTTANANVAMVEIKNPIHRYITPVIIRAGANTATGDMYHGLGNASAAPTTNVITNTQNAVLLESPALGTP